MRLVRLALENWRGVDSREIHFDDGVTLIEGPNEIGKSTIVEALLTLVRELDSSKKQGVKAVMPVGQDVGSRVEAEIRSGDYHFVYAKTYNKTTGTSLDILAPRKEQLTGREAHERVEQILNETMDLSLWYGLLAEQGKSTAPAELQDSAGLAHALDEAAGSSASTQEDTDLYAAVQAEYTRYYTLKTGKPQFASLEKATEQARADRDAARHALAEVERNAEEQERIQTDVRRRQQLLPGLEAKVREHEESWKAVGSLKKELELKDSQLEAATGQVAAANKAAADRRVLIEAIARERESLAEQQKVQQPLKDRLDELKRKAESARLVAEDKTRQRNKARKHHDVARQDVDYLANLERLAQAEKKLDSHKELSTKLKSASQTLNQVKIDDDGLETLRQLDRKLELARQKRDLAATEVVVSAESVLDFEIDGEPVSLGQAEAAERTAAAGMDIRFPGVATVRIVPPHSAADLEAGVSDAEEDFRQALGRHAVESLEEAIEQNETRRTAQHQVRELKSKLEEILGDETPEELDELARSLRGGTAAYPEQRTPGTDLPATMEDARERLAAAEQAFRDADEAIEEVRKQETALRTEQAGADEALREAGDAIVALEATLREKEKRLETARQEASDDDLETRIQETVERHSALAAEMNDIRQRLEALAPDTVETLYTNARDACERARKELAETERKLAVLDDRLEQAQADGRFETLEAAERKLGDLERDLDATRRRAEAAKRLWDTLNRHRDAARQAYVRPLKEAIERLGRIVFGPTFGIEISDDWTLESRVLDNTLLPFDDLSVGAKEQLGILTRLAAAQIVAKQGGVPLIIDDALGFSDPSRLDTMGAAISAAGKHCQIVILTCTPGRFSNVGSATTVQF
ncbi:MAG: AAA family ATPase [Woeseiaceae bacterium]|jgi:DNA repair exonuclease SbcCD ATPase subunit|nr:AAA family ATPase [Woeseiaceae bacterium]